MGAQELGIFDGHELTLVPKVSKGTVGLAQQRRAPVGLVQVVCGKIYGLFRMFMDVYGCFWMFVVDRKNMYFFILSDISGILCAMDVYGKH